MHRLPPLRELQAFESAARLLSFRKAAEELSVTPTAVSHQIRLLERYCGQPLFQRQPRPLQLTTAGAQLLPVVRDAFLSISDELARLCDTPKITVTPVREGRALDVAQVGLLIAEGRTTEHRALIATMVYGGLRRAEAAALTWAEVQVKGGAVTLHVLGKGGKYRPVLLRAEPAVHLFRLLLAVPRDPGARVFGVGAAHVRQIVALAASRAGLGHVAPHDLRRTYATLSRKAGVDVLTLQATMGHASPKTTARYDRRPGSEIAMVAADAMAAYLKREADDGTTGGGR